MLQDHTDNFLLSLLKPPLTLESLFVSLRHLPSLTDSIPDHTPQTDVPCEPYSQDVHRNPKVFLIALVDSRSLHAALFRLVSVYHQESNPSPFPQEASIARHLHLYHIPQPSTRYHSDPLAAPAHFQAAQQYRVPPPDHRASENDTD